MFGSFPSGRPVHDVDESGWGTPEGDDDEPDVSCEEESGDADDDMHDDGARSRAAGVCGLSLNLSRTCGVLTTVRAADLTVSDDDVTQSALSNGSLVIQRTVRVVGSVDQHVAEFREVFVPYRDVAGLLPECLFLDYSLWVRYPVNGSSAMASSIVGYPVHGRNSFNSTDIHDEESTLRIETSRPLFANRSCGTVGTGPKELACPHQRGDTVPMSVIQKHFTRPFYEQLRQCVLMILWPGITLAFPPRTFIHLSRAPSTPLGQSSIPA